MTRGDEDVFVQTSMAWLIILNRIEGDSETSDGFLRDLRSRFPGFTLTMFQGMWLQMWKDKRMANRFADYLRAAGLPEN